MQASWDGERLNVNLQTAHATALQILVCLWWRVVPPCVYAEKIGARDVSEVVLTFDGIPGPDGEVADGVSKSARVAFLKFAIGEESRPLFAECLLNRIDWIREQLPRLEWDADGAQRVLDRMQSERAKFEHALRSSLPGTWDYLFDPRWPWLDDDSQTPATIPLDEPCAPNGQQGDEPPGRLGLMVNRTERKVRRVGFTPTVEVSGKVEWPLFIALYDAGESSLTVEQLKAIDGEDNAPARRATKKRLKEKLADPLGITIPDANWSLECVTPA